ncbi:hypothetical protein A2U01_0094043, partial [Trifolium medium]|nr:hypothetical protein [Trifolium medium]
MYPMANKKTAPIILSSDSEEETYSEIDDLEEVADEEEMIEDTDEDVDPTPFYNFDVKMT